MFSAPQGLGVLRQGHTGVLLEHGGEVIDIVIAHSHGNLGEVKGTLLDQPLGFFDP